MLEELLGEPAASSNGNGHRLRPRVSRSPREQAILALLKQGPRRTKEIAHELNADLAMTRRSLQQLAKAKQITVSGATASRRWALA